MSVQRVLVSAMTHYGTGSPRKSVPRTMVGSERQRSNDSLTTNPEHLQRRVCLTLTGGLNVDEIMQLMHIVL